MGIYRIVIEIYNLDKNYYVISSGTGLCIMKEAIQKGIGKQMEKNQILKIYGTEYKQMTKKLLDRAELASMIPGRDCRIGIKPNLVSPSQASWGATTHPEIIAGIIEYLQERGFENLVIMEGSWVGDRTAEAIEVCGYDQLCEKYHVPFCDAQQEPGVEKDCGGLRLNVCRITQEIDFLINVPVMKGHCQTRITCALKNMKGLIPNKEKRRFHALGLHKPIAHLNMGIRQDFIVIDHICGDLDFEDGGNPVSCDCIMAAADPVLADAYVCELMHYSVDEVPYIRMAEELGAGSTDIGNAEILTYDQAGDRWSTEIHAREDLPAERKIADLKDAVEEVESCSACYGYLIPALDRLRKEGLLDKLHTKICIGQGYQGETGELGIGRCTSGFRCSVKGCPPTETQIYEFLAEYIRNSSEKMSVCADVDLE